MLSDELFREISATQHQVQKLQARLSEEFSTASERGKEFILDLKQGNSCQMGLLGVITEALRVCNNIEKRGS